jgi:hypothetical protein
MLKGKAEARSKTEMSSAKNSGPGRGKFKAKVGSPLELGLSSQSKQDGGSAAKIRQVTNESEQRPDTMREKISSDRGTFNYC